MEYKSQNVICQNCKKDFTIEPDDFSFYEKINVPPPTFCPECRLQRRFTFRNERTLYKRQCDLCKKEIISLYSKDSSFVVYCYPCWYGDDWDPRDFGKDYDFSKSFFEQFKELMSIVPRPSLIGTNNFNSPYANYAGNLKNCYLVNCSDACEDSAFCDRTFYSKESFDCFGLANSELCYESNQCIKSFKIGFSNNSENLVESIFIKNCKNLIQCLGCVNLRNGNNFILNKKVSKEEYEKKIEKLSSYIEFKKFNLIFKDLLLKVPHRFSDNVLAINSDGNELFETRNCKNSFFVRNGENLKNAYFCSKIKDSCDFSFADNAELVYESSNIEQNFMKLFSLTCWYSNNISYSDLCLSCSEIFGSVGLRNKQYCILNKQYTKEEYEELVPKIIQHMNDMPYIDSKGRVYKYGEFFPSELSPFCYNETIAQDFFLLTKKDVLFCGYKWIDKDTHQYKMTLNNNDIPDNIKEISENILNEIIECEHKEKCNHQCTKAFRLIQKELEFYKQMNLPIPRLCPNCRYYLRLKERNPIKLWERECDCAGIKSKNGLYENSCVHSHDEKKCEIKFKTSYAPDRPEIVYCEHCYNKEVY